VLETEKRRKETNCKRLGCVQPKSSSVWHTGLSGGAPDSVWCARLVSGENAALGIRRRRTTIIHQTVQWCTGLSGESSAANSSPSGKAKGRRGYNSPDCPVRHSTEGKDGLPSLPPTAPSCLGAIKGTPRRMEESPKHSLSILKHPDSAPAHSLHCTC
jgi:hypothetical protein